jgi:hypothetical protein
LILAAGIEVAHCVHRLLKDRDTIKLEWVEPWPAISKDGTPKDAVVVMRATVADCIDLYRRELGNCELNAELDELGNCELNDAALLDGFMAVHWAVPVEE